MPLRRIPQSVRLALGHAFLVTAVAVALVALVAWSRREAAVRSFDARLLETALDTSQRLMEDPEEQSGAVAREAVGRSHALLYVEIADERGRVLGRSSAAVGDRLPLLRTESPPERPQFADVAPSPGGRAMDADPVVRYVTLPFLDEDGDPYLVRAVARTTGPQEMLADLVRGLRWGAPLGLVAAAAFAWMLARRTLRPLHAVAAAASQVTPGTLGRGIEVADAEGEIRHLQESLNRALQRLDEAFEEQSRFAANVSHELKTPIAVLLAQAQVLDPMHAPAADVAAFRTSVVVEMRRLGRTVESFLVLARCGPDGAMENARPVPLLDVVLEVVHHGAEAASQDGVRLVPRFELADESRPPVVRGDPNLLRTMIDNLVANAVRFSPHGEAVDLHVATSDAEVRITVRDRGPGIPPGYERRVFDRFAQAPVDAPRRGGFGLGLNIAATLARLHGGSIEARNREDRGCEFVISLPLEAPAATDEAAAGPAPSPRLVETPGGATRRAVLPQDVRPDAAGR